MSLKRTVQYWRIGFIAISIMILLSVPGCGDTHLEDEQVVESEIAVQDQQQNVKDNEDEIIEICSQLYKKASEENKIADLEMIRIIVNQFGENGYPAVDSRNQIDMTEAEQVEWFCEMVDTQEEAEITIIEVSYLGGFVKYDLETKDGNVDVVRSYYKYENGNMKREVTGSYQAEYWNYTEDGYLMFSGVWFSEELYVLTLSGAEEHTALRVQPLDETYRELSRKYLLPIGFEQNNMFIVDWSEDDFGELNFYDMFDLLYPKVYGTNIPYFIYAYEEVMAHAGLREYWRIKPLSDKCRELTEKYISGLSYVNYNVLVTNWDSNNVEDILMPCMYEDIYRIYTGENLKTEDWKIPGEEFEKIMTTYFPVSVDQLREHCGYDEGSNSYEYEMIYASPYPPFGEVVDYTENADGTITLIVDGVWPDYNSDLAFRNTVVVQPFEDGTFRYLSNSIEQIELELPPIARTKG